MKNWLEYVEDSFVKQPNGSVSLTVRACKWLNADRICMVIETLLGSGTGFSVQILITSGEYRIYLDKKYSAHTVSEFNDFISKKLWPYDESQQVSDEKFEKAFAKQEKAKPDGTGYTADLAYNGLWVGLVRVSGEIDEHDFLVVSVLGRSVLEAALFALHRSYRAVKAMPTVTEVAMPSKLSLENTNFHSPYAAAYVIKRDNAWIGADGMIRRLNDLIMREGSNFGDAYARRLQERGGSNGQAWYRSAQAAKFFMELNVEPVALKQEKPKAAGKWLRFVGPSDSDPNKFCIETSLGTRLLVKQAISAYMTAVGLESPQPEVISPAVLGRQSKVIFWFGSNWRSGSVPDFVSGLNAFVENALGLDPANPTVKAGKTAALWKLAEDMRGQKGDKSMKNWSISYMTDRFFNRDNTCNDEFVKVKCTADQAKKVQNYLSWAYGLNCPSIHVSDVNPSIKSGSDADRGDVAANTVFVFDPDGNIVCPKDASKICGKVYRVKYLGVLYSRSGLYTTEDANNLIAKLNAAASSGDKFISVVQHCDDKEKTDSAFVSTVRITDLRTGEDTWTVPASYKPVEKTFTMKRKGHAQTFLHTEEYVLGLFDRLVNKNYFEDSKFYLRDLDRKDYVLANPSEIELFDENMNQIWPKQPKPEADSAETKKPEAKSAEAKRAVWGAGSGSLFEDAG